MPPKKSKSKQKEARAPQKVHKTMKSALKEVLDRDDETIERLVRQGKETFRDEADPCWDKSLTETWRRDGKKIIWSKRPAAQTGTNLKRSSMMRSWKQCQKEQEGERKRAEKATRERKERTDFEGMKGKAKTEAARAQCSMAVKCLPPASSMYCQYAHGSSGKPLKIGNAYFKVQQGPKMKLVGKKWVQDGKQMEWQWIKVRGSSVVKLPDGRKMTLQKGYKPKRMGKTINAAVRANTKDGKVKVRNPDMRAAKYQHVGEYDPDKGERKRFRIAGYQKKTRGPTTPREVWGEALEQLSRWSSGPKPEALSAMAIPIYNPVTGWRPPRRVSLWDAIKLEQTAKDVVAVRVLFYGGVMDAEPRGHNREKVQAMKTFISSLKLSPAVRSKYNTSAAVKSTLRPSKAQRAERYKDLPSRVWPKLESIRLRTQAQIKQKSMTATDRKFLRSLIQIIDRMVVGQPKSQRGKKGYDSDGKYNRVVWGSYGKLFMMLNVLYIALKNGIRSDEISPSLREFFEGIKKDINEYRSKRKWGPYLKQGVSPAVKQEEDVLGAEMDAMLDDNVGPAKPKTKRKRRGLRLSRRKGQR